MPYAWIKALHVISVIAWMAGLLYLPRLFVYHAGAEPASDLSETLKVMERRLLRAIMNPAMIASWGFGHWMLVRNPGLLQQPFMQVKLACVVALTILHMLLAYYRRAFAEDRNTHSARYFRFLNEAPTLLMIVIIIMIIVQPQLKFIN